MMQQQNMFRKSAVEKLSSPEQLDVMMQVTSPLGWLSLIALGVILLFVVIWSVVGSIAINVDGRGILLRGQAVLDITSGSGGRVTEVMVQSGQVVSKGQPVARLDQPELALKIENAREELRDVERENAEVSSRGSSLSAQYQSQLRELRAKAATQKQMVDKGLLTNAVLMRTREQITATEQMLAQSQLTQSGRAGRAESIRRSIEEMESKLASSTVVASPYDGRVIEVMTDPGALVGAGSRIVTLEPLDEDIETILYVPATEGKKIQPGMSVRISPSTVKAEEFGFMLGEVSRVSDFPMTPEGLRRVLRNDKLVEQLTGEGAPIEVVAKLVPDPSTPSGFRWSSSQGPPQQVFSGTICTGSVVVETKKPIAYVLPILKKTVGVN
jgi:HlyD family secretion protein